MSHCSVPSHCFAPESTIKTKNKALTCIKQVLLLKRGEKKKINDQEISLSIEAFSKVQLKNNFRSTMSASAKVKGAVV